MHVSAIVIQYLGSQYQSVERSGSGESLGIRVQDKDGRRVCLSDVCMRNWLSGMVSAALGRFP